MIAFMWYMALRKVVAGGKIHLIVLTRYKRNASSFGDASKQNTEEVTDCSIQEIWDYKICSRYSMENEKSD